MSYRIPRLEMVAEAPTADPHMNVVLCVRYARDLKSTSYVTWVYNRQDCGFHHGHYFPVRDGSDAEAAYALALQDFADRVKGGGSYAGD